MAVVTSKGRAAEIEPLELAFDSAAISGLYERNASRVFGYCLSRLGRREDAEDAVQTTFLHAIRGLRRGVVPLVESAWLLGIARNVCLTRREALGRRKRLEAVCDPHDLENVAPAVEAARDELMGLEEALARLPERQRRAVLLRDWRGLSYDEVAAELGVSRAAVETLIFRGRQALADLLGEEPRDTRKRLASLGNLGSLVTAVKAFFGGGAIAVKVAAAVAVVSGAGLAVEAKDVLSARGTERGSPPVVALAPASGTPAAPSSSAPAGEQTPTAATNRTVATSATAGHGQTPTSTGAALQPAGTAPQPGSAALAVEPAQQAQVGVSPAGGVPAVEAAKTTVVAKKPAATEVVQKVGGVVEQVAPQLPSQAPALPQLPLPALPPLPVSTPTVPPLPSLPAPPALPPAPPIAVGPVPLPPVPLVPPLPVPLPPVAPPGPPPPLPPILP